MWPHVAENARALVFVVDASDVARFGAAREELRALLASPRTLCPALSPPLSFPSLLPPFSGIQEMQPPVLVMLNKVDRVQDVSEELRRSMREGSASRPRPAAGERARGRRRRRRRRRDEGSDEDEDEEEGEGEEGEGEEGEEEEEEGGAVEWTEEQTAQMRQRDPAMLLSKLPLLLATEALRVRHQYRCVGECLRRPAPTGLTRQRARTAPPCRRFVETSAVTGRGIAEGINWLADKM